MILIDADNIARIVDVARLEENCAVGTAGWVCHLYHNGNASLVDAPTPEPWQPGCWRMTGEPAAPYFELVAVPDAAAWYADRIETERDTRIAAGMPYTFPDAVKGTVQLRNERDIINVTGVGTAGLMLDLGGDGATKLQFRDAEDVTHELTGEEARKFGLAVSAWISANYARAWALKEAVAAALKAQDCSALTAVDITTGWPAGECV